MVVHHETSIHIRMYVVSETRVHVYAVRFRTIVINSLKMSSNKIYVPTVQNRFNVCTVSNVDGSYQVGWSGRTVSLAQLFFFKG